MLALLLETKKFLTHVKLGLFTRYAPPPFNFLIFHLFVWLPPFWPPTIWEHSLVPLSPKPLYN